MAPPSADGLAAESHKTRSNDGRRNGGRGQDGSGGGSGSGSGGGGGARARVCVPVSPDHPWRFTAEALRLSPSFRKSVHPSTEAKYRVAGLQFIRALAGRVFEEELRDKKQLDVAHCTWSAVVYFQRFYTRQSYTAWDRKVRLARRRVLRWPFAVAYSRLACALTAVVGGVLAVATVAVPFPPRR